MSSLEQIAKDLEAAAEEAAGELLPVAEALAKRTRLPLPHLVRYQQSWSNSFLGPHSLMYFEGLRPPPANYFWDKEWGFLHHQPGWEERSVEEVERDVESRSGVTLDELRAEGEELRKRIRHHHDRLMRIAARLPAKLASEGGFDARRSDLEKLDDVTVSYDELAKSYVTGQHMSRDSASVNAGLRLPPHLYVETECMVVWGVTQRAQEMVRAARLAAAAADGLSHLRPSPPSRVRSDDPSLPAFAGSPDVMTTIITGLAVVLVLLATVAGAVLGILQADDHLQPTDSSLAPWAIAKAAAGGAGLLALILAGAAAWYGLLRRRPDHVRLTFGKPLAWGAGLALGGALLIIFGIG